MNPLCEALEAIFFSAYEGLCGDFGFLVKFETHFIGQSRVLTLSWFVSIANV